jgi:lysozyme
MANNLKISAAGIAAISQREGVRTRAYQDVRGIWTIGVGHTGPEVHAGLVWTMAQVDAALAKDLGWAEAAVNEDITHPLTQNQFDALVSLTYNIGAAGFAGSSVRRQLNLGNVQVAADDFLMWEKPAVLRARREGERRQFLGA